VTTNSWSFCLVTLADKASCSFHMSQMVEMTGTLLCAVRPAVTLTVCSYPSLRPEGSGRASTSWCMFAMVETLSEEHESSDFIAASKSCLSFVLCVYATGFQGDSCTCRLQPGVRKLFRHLKEVDSGLKQLRCHSPRQEVVSRHSHQHITVTLQFAIG
jgi:hypothetical protein